MSCLHCSASPNFSHFLPVVSLQTSVPSSALSSVTKIGFFSYPNYCHIPHRYQSPTTTIPRSEIQESKYYSPPPPTLPMRFHKKFLWHFDIRETILFSFRTFSLSTLHSPWWYPKCKNPLNHESGIPSLFTKQAGSQHLINRYPSSFNMLQSRAYHLLCPRQFRGISGLDLPPVFQTDHLLLLFQPCKSIFLQKLQVIFERTFQVPKINTSDIRRSTHARQSYAVNYLSTVIILPSQTLQISKNQHTPSRNGKIIMS